MPQDPQILEEVAKLGRVTPQQERVLYNIALRQDELGREPTNMFKSKLEESEDYKALLDREYITYEVFGHAGSKRDAVVSVYVTLKGMRYAITFAEEISALMPWDPAGNVR